MSSLLTPELQRRLEQFQLLAAQRAHRPPSAKRMNMNSRGCQPTESHRKTNSTLKGANHQPSHRAARIRRAHYQSPIPLFGPFRADVLWLPLPWVSRTENHRKSNSTLKGSHHQSSKRAARIRWTHRQATARLLGPFRADVLWLPLPWVSPTAIRVVRLRRTAAPTFVGNYFYGPNRNACNYPKP
jgi:hypothetical protein